MANPTHSAVPVYSPSVNSSDEDHLRQVLANPNHSAVPVYSPSVNSSDEYRTLLLCQVKRAAEEKAKARAMDQRARGVDPTLTQSKVRLTDRARQLMGFTDTTDTAASSAAASFSFSSGKGTSGSASSSSSTSFQYVDYGAEGVWEAVRDKCVEKVRERVV